MASTATVGPSELVERVRELEAEGIDEQQAIRKTVRDVLDGGR